MKAQIIDNYMRNVVINNNINIDLIEEELTRLLGEKPAVRVEWDATISVNEASGKEIREEKINKLTILFTDIYSDKIQSISYLN
jgi:hypothetical protein